VNNFAIGGEYSLVYDKILLRKKDKIFLDKNLFGVILFFAILGRLPMVTERR
jgi:hypothetical protein